jgi:hypothetical protein
LYKRPNFFSADTSELEAAIIQSEVVKAAKQLNEEEENSSDPLENLKEMKFLPNAGSDLISKVLKIIRKKVLGILFPDGVIYHSGQLEVLSRAQKSGTPLIFINLGEINTVYIRKPDRPRFEWSFLGHNLCPGFECLD